MWTSCVRTRGDNVPGLRERKDTTTFRPGTTDNTIMSLPDTLLYGLFGWRRQPPQGPHLYSTHRKTLFGAMTAGLVAVGLMEAMAVHVLIVVLTEDDWVAWALTGLTLYGLLFLGAMYNKVRLNPLAVAVDGLLVPNPIGRPIAIPWTRIAAVEQVAVAPARAPGLLLAAVPFGTANVLVTLAQPMERKVAWVVVERFERVGLSVDDPAGFIAAVRSHLPTAEQAPQAG